MEIECGHRSVKIRCRAHAFLERVMDKGKISQKTAAFAGQGQREVLASSFPF